MVKFTNTLLIAAVAAPAFAAPVQLSAHEPPSSSGLKQGAHYAGKVISRVGTAGTVGPVVGDTKFARDFDELDAREPRDLKGVVAGVKKAAHAAGKVLKHSADGAIVGSTVYSATQSREFDEIDARGPRDLKGVVAGVKKAAHAAGKVLKHSADGAIVGSTIYSATQSREFEELDAREPINLKGVVTGVKKIAQSKKGRAARKVASGVGTAATVGSVVASTTQSREFDELDAREPINLKGVVTGVKKIAQSKKGRAARKVASGVGTAATVGSVVASTTQSREFNELDARSPRDLKGVVTGAKKIAHAAGKVLSHSADAAVVGSTVYSATKSRELNELDAREHLYYILRDEETGEYFARELSSLDELD